MPTWNTLATPAIIQETMANMEKRNLHAQLVQTKAEALEKIKALIPAGSEIMMGSSTTLHQIGFMDYAASDASPWRDLQLTVHAENDEAKRHELRRKAVTADYFLLSANAVTQDGKIVLVDNTGSRGGAVPYAAGHLIFVIGTQKIVPTLDDAFTRIHEYVRDKEDARMMEAYNIHTGFGKWVIVENEVQPERIHVIFVNEALGF